MAGAEAWDPKVRTWGVPTPETAYLALGDLRELPEVEEITEEDSRSLMDIAVKRWWKRS